MAGDPETGVMVMRMEDGLDTGPVLSEERVSVGRKTFGELHDELAQIGAGLMLRTLASLERGTAQMRTQNNALATYAKKIENADARIDWRLPANEVDCLVRGLAPLPGAWCEHRHERLKVLMTEPVEQGGKPGEVLDDRLTIACGQNAVRITRLQRAGRAPMNAQDFLRGYTIPAGTHLA